MNTISQFWNWFKDNNKGYTFLHSVEEDVKEKLLSECVKQLHTYCDHLYFEIGGYPDEEQELIITAEGDKDYFGAAEELIKAAPQIPGWIFTALKPAITEPFKSKWDELELNTEDMWFLPLSNDEDTDLGIRICLRNHELIKDNEILMPLLFKMLDTIVGEKSFALDIQYVDTALLPDEPEEEGLYPILELPEFIDWHKQQNKSS